jgi:UDP-glucose 4-epimerase
VIGEMHYPETHLIPLAIEAAISGTNFRIYGSDYDTPDGTCIRDFIHVNDLASAHYLALSYLFDGGKSERINLGSGFGVSVSEILNIISIISKRNIIVEAFSRRDGDPAKLISSIVKAKEILGWEPEYSDIHQIIFDAMAWYKKEKIDL